MNRDEQLAVAMKLARDAGALVREHYGKVERLTKRGDEAVSEADRASQRLIVSGLRRIFPRDGVVGEENETGDAITFEVPDPDGRNWVIDPIDGTNNFLAGLGTFGVCIGLLEAGQPVLGVVYDVMRDEMYAGAQGRGAKVGVQPITVAKTPMGDNAMLMLTSNLLNANSQAPGFVIRWLGQTNWKLRMLGSAALEAVQVAAGVAHGALTLNGKLWDVVAPAAVVLAAGGVVTGPSGADIFPFNLRNYSGAKVPFLAAAPAAHGELVAEIAR
jgi:myo-inositol-1(or 4)-monophosphatase